MSRIKDKVALITGGNSGIGRATALLFAREGAKVVIAARDAAKAEATLADIEGEARYIACDVRQPEECRKAVDFTIEQFGRIDILFNNAGIVPVGTVLETTYDEWQDAMATNAGGVFLMSQAALPHMIGQGGGVIINNASDVAILGGQQRAAYSATKGATGMLTRCMALDHARQGIRVNAICPGETYVHRWDTRADDMQAYLKGLGDALPLGRVADPAEIARAVLFLASDDSSFMTGQLMAVDGGNTAGGVADGY